MKRFSLLALIISCLLLLAGCASTSGTLPGESIPNSVSGTYEDDNIKIIVKGSTYNSIASSLSATIYNKSNSLVTFDLNNSAYVQLGVSSKRMIDGETLKIDINRSQPSYPVAPNSVITRNLYSTDYELGFPFADESKVLIAYQLDGNLKFAEIQLLNETDIKTEFVGEVKISKNKWHPFFIGSTVKQLEKDALEQAEGKYGDNVLLSNIRYSTEWSPLSLLLYFNLWGYVEKGELTADVVRYAYN